MIVGVALPVVYRPPEFDRINFLHTHRKLPHDYVILAERVYNVVARGSQTGQFRHKSFYRFGIASCLATSHKQILKTPCSMTSSCILGFQATRPPTTGCQIKGKEVSTRARLFSALVINNRRV